MHFSCLWKSLKIFWIKKISCDSMSYMWLVFISYHSSICCIIFISVYITVWGAQSTLHLNLLRWVWRCSHVMSHILNRASFFARNFYFDDDSDPSGRYCWPKKVTRSAKFVGWLDCADLYFFESPDLSWKNSFKRGMKLKIIFFTTIWISHEV